MARLNLTIDDDVLRRARIRALEEGTSVNAVVRQMLAAYSDRGRSRRVLDQVLEHAAASAASSGTARSWKRDDLYD